MKDGIFFSIEEEIELTGNKPRDRQVKRIKPETVASSARPAEKTLGLVPLIAERIIKEKVSELGHKISEDYRGIHLHLVGLLKGAWVFTADLARQLQLETSIDFMTVASYAEATRSGGCIEIVQDLQTNIRGRHVLVVEDICDSGLTLNRVCRELWHRKPESLKVVSLLDKPARRVEPVDLDYIGFEILNKFVVGYGLDYQQKFRNLPCISAIVPHETDLLNRKRT